MTDDREIMQMALEAMEVLTDNYDDNAVGIEIDAIIALRKRLAQQEQERREWQGLTDEDVRDLWSWSMTAEAERTANTQQHAFALAVAAKLKEKNT